MYISTDINIGEVVNFKSREGCTKFGVIEGITIREKIKDNQTEQVTHYLVEDEELSKEDIVDRYYKRDY